MEGLFSDAGGIMAIQRVNFEQAKSLMDNENDLMVIDVREEGEYITGHAEGAELLPMSELDEISAEELIPDKRTPILLYCRTGRRAHNAAALLDSYGYENIYDVGGLAGWPYGLEW